MRLVKNVGKALVVRLLAWQLKRLRAKNSIHTVGVVGSYGKTSTKFAIATVLTQQFRVRFQAGNYNDIVTIPLVFFDEPMPSLLNPIAWMGVFLRNERQIRKAYPYDVVVLELGTDGPGQIAQFSRYLELDVAVVTALDHEHMDSFADIQAVADEELAVQRFSKQLIVNTDLCAKKYLAALDKPVTFGFDKLADYRLKHLGFIQKSHHFHIMYQDKLLLEASTHGLSKVQIYSACAATIVARHFDMPKSEIVKGIAAITPVSGRMQLLDGIRGSLILDETYNASPAATRTALDVLYSLEAPQKIALLGNMNELGVYSKAAHQEIGGYCEPEQLDIVLTLGPDANAYLAPAARARGCRVETFTTPFAAGAYLKEHIRDGGAAILAKGSQNNVFAEEAVKLILADPTDATRLVRQSPRWLKKKQQAFQK